MSEYDFVIGSTPIPENSACSLKFHQYTIYDSVNWTQSGLLYWNATLKQFEVIPDPPPQPPQPQPQINPLTMPRNIDLRNPYSRNK